MPFTKVNLQMIYLVRPPGETTRLVDLVHDEAHPVITNPG